MTSSDDEGMIVPDHDDVIAAGRDRRVRAVRVQKVMLLIGIAVVVAGMAVRLVGGRLGAGLPPLAFAIAVLLTVAPIAREARRSAGVERTQLTKALVLTVAVVGVHHLGRHLLHLADASRTSSTRENLSVLCLSLIVGVIAFADEAES